MIRKTVLWGGVLLLALCRAMAAGAAEEGNNRIVAVVNNEVITWLDLEKATKAMVPAGVDAANPEVQKQVLFQLIDQKLLEIQIKKQGLQVGKEEVDAALKRLRQEQGLSSEAEFKSALEKQGISEEELRRRLGDQILRFRLVNREVGSKIIFPEARIREYYDQNRDKFSAAEKVHLAQILIQSSATLPPEAAKAKAEDIRERLLRGEDFARLARSVSQETSAAQGGDLGVFELAELDPALQQTVSSLQPGQISPPQPLGEGWRIIKLVDREKTAALTLEQARGRIQEMLYQEEMEARYKQWIQGLRDRSSIQILL